jgi:hypothetical protein
MAHTHTKEATALYPLISKEEKKRIWERARGIWKAKRPEPITELKKIRKEWSRRMPRIHR